MDFLYDNLSLADKITYSDEFWRENVEKTLEIRDRMQWGIPEREFKHFVLPLRVNNESLDSFRTVYADELCDRVEGMSMYDAVLEINHWCHEMATYRPSDARTSSPMATIGSGFGRCGEESVLGVAALRAVGIPARQVYTPRWAHTDDNHAWIEAWVDGKWYFLGACEPEPKLNMGWFNASVSRALLLHTKVFGDYDGDEDVISRAKSYTEINVTNNYVPVRASAVRVLDENGEVVEGATVEYKIYNYAEFFTVAKYVTGTDGTVMFHTGYGDMLAWAYKGNKFGLARINGEVTELVLGHEVGERFGLDLDIVPPSENPIPTNAAEEEIEECKRRMAEEDAIREAREKATGKVVRAFIEENGMSEDAVMLCESLNEKDMEDVARDVLDDALMHIDGKFEMFRDCPRIELEVLHPYFNELSGGSEFNNPVEIIEWVKNNIEIDDEANPQHLRIPPVMVWRARKSDSISRNIFFVAMCRAAGFSARIDNVTGKTQFLEGNHWVDVNFSGAEIQASKKGFLDVNVDSDNDPLYYRHFTLAKIEGGNARLLSFDENSDQPASELFAEPMSLDCGYYCLTSGKRLADGSVLAHIEFFNIEDSHATEVPLFIRSSSDRISVIGAIDAEPFLPFTGRDYFLIAALGDKDEPTDHAIRQLNAISEDINKWGRVCLFYGKAHPEGIEKAIFNDGGENIREMLCKGCKIEKLVLPTIAVCDSFGHVVYISQGYNTSLAEDLTSVINQLGNN